MNGEGGQAERRVVERIVMLLLALAGLAERAAGLPMPLRVPLLLILSRAESVARGFVAGAGWVAPEPGAERVGDGFATRLAAALRALARALGALLFRSRSSVGSPARRGAAAAGLPGSVRGAAGCLAAPDTS